MAHQTEKLFGFRIAQRRGGLVQNQEIAFGCYGAGDQNHLLLRKRQILHQRIYIYVDVQAVEYPARLFSHAAPVNEGVDALVLHHVIHHHVFGDGQRGHEGGIDLLIHDLHAQLLGVHRAFDFNWLAVELDGARIMRIRAGQHLHQGGFSGAVRADDRAYFSGGDFEVHFLQGLDPRKFNGYILGG